MPSRTSSKNLRNESSSSTTWRLIAAGAGAFLLTALATGWFFWSWYEDPDVRRVKELSEQLFKPDNNLSQEERGRLFAELREAGEKLTESQREQVWAERGNSFRARMDQQLDEYFALPKEERVAYLDRQIKQMEERRREFEQRMNANGGAQRGGPPGDWRGGGRGRRGGGDAETTFRRRMLDNTTPEQRAKWTQYMDDMTKRRQQLGLPPRS